jgi:uncharacterized membrane protein YfcA
MRLELDFPPAISCWVWPNWILLCSATKDLSEILSLHYHRPSAIWDGAVRLFGKKMHFHVTFPISGVETWVFLPPLVAFVVSLFCSMAGVSGAFLLLPFQISFLHFVSPSVSSTNFVYNIVAIPSGVYRYIREGRMNWPLAWIIIAGTLPGVFLGYYIRILYLPNPDKFRLFVGCVLLYIGARLFMDAFRVGAIGHAELRITAAHNAFKDQNKTIEAQEVESARVPVKAEMKTIGYSSRTVTYEFRGRTFSFGIPTMFALAFMVGIIGGAYGIGGGAIMSPFCVGVFGLPVYTVAGAALFGTFMTSIAGVFFYSTMPASNGISSKPDWLLGILFGLGGFLGMYCGARLQRFVSQRLIKGMLAVMMLFLACMYVGAFFEP